jgi:hypothetical protein
MSKRKQVLLFPITYHLSPITAFSFLIGAWLDGDFVEHVLMAECLCDAFRLMLGERAFGVAACDFKESLVEHQDAQIAKRNAGRNLYLAHVVYAKAPGLLDPVFDEWVAERVLGFGFRQVSTLYNQTVFASLICFHGAGRKCATADDEKNSVWRVKL